MSHDLRHALRALARTPAFTAAAILTLAIGMAGTIAIFALVQAVLLRPLPLPDADNLVVGWRALPEAHARHWPFARADLDLLRDERRLFAGVAGVGYQGTARVPWGERGSEAIYVQAARVTGEFFDVLGVTPLLGRALAPADDRRGAENVVVLSHRFWQRRFGGAHDVLGRQVSLAGQPFTIVGIMPQGVEHPAQVEAWTTVAAMQTTTSNAVFRDAMAAELDLLGRLPRGVTIEEATSAVSVLGARLDARRSADETRGLVPQLQLYREFAVGDVKGALTVLLAAVALVLVIASANVANLTLARAPARRGELAVRAALGAGRARIVRQLLVESAVLAIAASAIALLVAARALPVMLRLLPDALPRTEGIRVDAIVVSFGAVIAVVSTLVAGLVPAFASTGGLLAHLGAARAVGSGSGTAMGRRAFVIAQVALAVVGVAAGGLLVGSLQRLRETGASLAADQLVYVPLALPQAEYADRPRLQRFMTELTDRLASLPGIAAVTPVNNMPFSGIGWDVPTFTAEGQSADESRTNPTLNLEEIHPGYFETFDVALVRGRSFTSDDDAGSPRVAILSQDVADRLWPGADAIGRRLRLGPPDSAGDWWTVVGVSAPTRYRDLREGLSTLYLPARQMLGAAESLVVRTPATASQVAAMVRAEAGRLDSAVAVMPPRPFTDLLEMPLAGPRFYAILIAVFAATGLGLAVVGLYGVVATGVRQRTREIGVRMALGADAARIRQLVMAEGARLVGAGVVVGIGLAVPGSQALRGMLFGVDPLEPTVLALAAMLPAGVGAVALYLPARRAGRLDPAVTLRAE